MCAFILYIMCVCVIYTGIYVCMCVCQLKGQSDMLKVTNSFQKIRSVLKLPGQTLNGHVRAKLAPLLNSKVIPTKLFHGIFQPPTNEKGIQ